MRISVASSLRRLWRGRKTPAHSLSLRSVDPEPVLQDDRFDRPEEL
jgi:hypothetical protein